MVIKALDVDRLSREFNEAQPFRFVCIDGLLEDDFAQEVAASYPLFEEAEQLGRGFRAVNENLKVQITEYAKFPEPTQRLADALASDDFRRTLEKITGIENLAWDERYEGGGMHQTASSGLLDVHVDFNYNAELQLFRRLNLLLYLNPVWEEQWGGLVELWNADVTHRHHAFNPVLNRCVIFETSEISYHGVTPVQSPQGVARKSFAVYYYTKEAPETYSGTPHSTLFKARPDEHVKRYIRMPAEQVKRRAEQGVRRAKDAVKKLIGLV